MKAYCEICNLDQPIIIETFKRDSNDPRNAWSDVICEECSFIVASLSNETEGNLVFMPLKEE